MKKKYIVRLTDEERAHLEEVINKLQGSGQKVKRAWILLQTDVDGPCWTDEHIGRAYHCRRKTVEDVRRRFVERGFEEALEGKVREAPPRAKLLSGEQEAQVIATRLGEPPAGYASWSLRLLSERVVELGIVESISYETVRRALKKTG